jgi:hypothetical protein
MDNQTVRNVYVIGPDKKIKLVIAIPMSTGRNFDEVLRVIDSMQLTAASQGGDAGELASRRQGDHPAGGQRRGSERAVPGRWHAPKPYSAIRATAGEVNVRVVRVVRVVRGRRNVPNDPNDPNALGDSTGTS